MKSPNRLLYSTILLVLVLSLAGAVRAQGVTGPAGNPREQPPAAAIDWDWQIEASDAPRLFQDMGDRSLALDAAGHPHVAYGGDHLYYARHDGTAWHLETVDPAADVGRYASLALDGAGRPHVSYYDEDNGGLKYAFYDGSSWQIETVESGGVGYGTSLALDSAGSPHISYCQYSCTPEGGCSCSQLRCAQWQGTSWQIETIGASGGNHTSIALDALGNAHIGYIYSDREEVRYAYDDGTAWQVETAAPAGYRTWYSRPSLALDSAGRPHVSYRRSGWMIPECLLYAYSDGSTWHDQEVDWGWYIGVSSSLALDAAGRPHISYANDGLQYATYDGTAWLTETVVPETGAVGLYSALALDAGGQARISYYTEGDLAYAEYDGTSWSSEPVDSGGTVGSYNDIALDGAGRPHVSYYDDVRQDLKYARYDGAAWQKEIVDSGVKYTALALDGAGRPHIAYLAYEEGSFDRRVKYAAYDGTAWQLETVDPTAMTNFGLSLVLDSQDHPHISYSTGWLIYAVHDGAGWQFQTVEEGGVYSSLVLDAQGRPHVSYVKTFTLHYAYHDGTTWQITSLYDAREAGTSLALDGAGRPHIAYYDRNGGLVYAYHDGVSWQNEIIASSAGEDDASISLALDGDDLPHILYYDSQQEMAQYAYRDGTGWQLKPVDPATIYGSLVLDAAGQPHVSYQSGNKLFYASRAACVPMDDVAITGPTALPLGVEGHYSAATTPPTATVPLFAWGDGQTGSEATYSWDTVGTYSIAVTATNECSTAQDSLTVTVFCQPPTGVEIAGPPSLLPGMAGTYRAAALPITTSPPLTFTWDGGTVGGSASYSWPATGTYTITVTATNACGQARGVLPVRVLSEWPYQAFLPLTVRAYDPSSCVPVHNLDFSWQPLTPTAGQVVTFTASANGMEPITYSWEFEMGNSRFEFRNANFAMGNPSTHTFPMAGMYTVTLTASNACGIEVLSQSLTVLPPVGPCVPVAVADFVWQPLTPTAGQVLTLTAGAFGRAWFSETIAPVAAGANALSLVLDGAGGPHLAYFATYPAGEVVYARYSGTAWLTETVAGVGGMGGYTDLALDAAGRPHLSYYDDSAPALRHAYYSGTAWVIETADSNGYYGNMETSLALDGAGYAHVSSYDNGSGDLRYARYDGSAWQVEVVDAAGRVGRWSSLVLDGAGYPRLSYSGDVPDHPLYYAYYDGANWITETVAPQGLYASLALDGAGRPHLAYQAGLTPPSGIVYATHDGTSWQMETVAVGEDPELSLDAAGRPHLAYVDAAGQSVRYLTHDGVGWVEETAVEGGDVWSLALALEEHLPGGPVWPHLAYYDDAAGELRHAGLVALKPTQPISYSWVLGDGSTAEGEVVTHTYTLSGTYSVVVTASNACGEAWRGREIVVVGP